jgi:outer membrane autotransporter protein
MGFKQTRGTGHSSLCHAELVSCGQQLSAISLALVVELHNLIASLNAVPQVHSNCFIWILSRKNDCMTRNGPRSVVRLALFALTTMTGGLLSTAAANAGCSPASGSNVTATCTGTTTDQGNGAPGSSTANFNGYGAGTENNLNVTVTQGATVTSTTAYGISFNTGSVTNSGTIAANGVGGRSIAADTVTVNNSGTISANGIAGQGISANTATVTNSGTIVANGSGGLAFNVGTANVTNSGIILGGSDGVGINVVTLSLNNSGTISASGANGIGIRIGATGDVTNSGVIIGVGGTALGFHRNGGSGSGGDVLTVLPGAQFGGLVDFNLAGGAGGADKINFGAGSWIINTAHFNGALSTITTPGNPYFVTPNQIVVADVSGFGAQNRAIMDITGWIGSVLPDAPVYAPGTGAGVNSFAATDTATNPFAAFASFPSDASDAFNAQGYAKAPAFKAASVAYADGQAVWAKGFGGQRQQDTNGAFIGSTTTGYGGAVGYERMVTPDLKLGALIGGSANKTSLDQNAGSTSTDTVFGGAYGRKTWGGTFLDLAVIGGNLDNSSVRNIGGGLAFTTASASYGGWFVMPSMMLGQRIDINRSGFTITPAVKLRYVAASFDGYTETGAGAAGLTVASRSFGAWDERAEVTFANTSTLAGGDRVTARVTGGILGQQRSSGGQVNVALLGQNFLATTPDRSSVTGAYGGAGLDWQIGKITLFAAGEATYTNDVARTYAGKGGVKVSW